VFIQRIKGGFNVSQTTSVARLSWSQKIGLAAGAVAALPAVAQTALVGVSNAPVSLNINNPYGTSAYWDIDQDSSADARLFVNTNTWFGNAWVNLDPENGGLAGMVATNSNTENVQVANLPDSFVVGQTLAANLWRAASNYMTMLGSLSTGASVFPGGNMVFGTNKIGFSFNKGGNLHYGFAVVDVTSTNVTIQSWMYDDTPGQGVHVIPEPATASMALLGLGAAGLLAWRGRRKAAAQNQA
jgi:hypothetical protein